MSIPQHVIKYWRQQGRSEKWIQERNQIYIKDYRSRKAMELAKRGENNGRAKLTEKKVKRIRHLREKYNFSYRVLARIFNVSGTSIRNVVKRKSWKHIK